MIFRAIFRTKFVKYLYLLPNQAVFATNETLPRNYSKFQIHALDC